MICKRCGGGWDYPCECEPEEVEEVQPEVDGYDPRVEVVEWAGADHRNVYNAPDERRSPLDLIGGKR